MVARCLDGARHRACRPDLMERYRREASRSASAAAPARCWRSLSACRSSTFPCEGKDPPQRLARCLRRIVTTRERDNDRLALSGAAARHSARPRLLLVHAACASRSRCSSITFHLRAMHSYPKPIRSRITVWDKPSAFSFFRSAVSRSVHCRFSCLTQLRPSTPGCCGRGACAGLPRALVRACRY